MIDGYPNDSSQAGAFVEFIGLPTSIIHLDVPATVMNARCQERSNFDDTRESIYKRIEKFNNSMMGLIRKWRNIAITVDGNRETNEVFEDIKTALKSKHVFAEVELEV